MARLANGRFKAGERSNPAAEFTKGQTPWNKGKVYERMLGEKHPQWKGGKPECLDCSKRLSTYTSRRCAPCHFKFLKTLTQPRNVGFKPGIGAGIGEQHPKWKGDKVSYSALHHWVRRKLGIPKICWECGFESDRIRLFHWANISREYKRDLDDWARLCAKCHKAYDAYKIELTLTQTRG